MITGKLVIFEGDEIEFAVLETATNRIHKLQYGNKITLPGGEHFVHFMGLHIIDGALELNGRLGMIFDLPPENFRSRNRRIFLTRLPGHNFHQLADFLEAYRSNAEVQLEQ